MSGIEFSDPKKQKEFVELITEFVSKPEWSGQVTNEQLQKAINYMESLRGSNYQVSNNVASKLINYKLKKTNEALKSLPEPPKYSPYNYYLEKELRKLKPPFRLPENVRPDMPEEAVIYVPSKFIQNKLSNIYITSNEAKRHKAYQRIIDIYLTDWLNRRGFKKNGVQMAYKPLFDDAGFLKMVEKRIIYFLQLSEEKPNPKTIKKLPGNSTRQQLLKDLLERVQKRLQNLMEEEYSNFNGGYRRKTSKSRMRLRKTRKNKK